ncbi:hypothetical protein UQW22_02515 [Isoptericola halotolerans]|uniref:hypothetical protein n=1 Tax=Isoptericola halotolerans TaxID=300560 RepID=UPI0038911057
MQYPRRGRTWEGGGRSGGDAGPAGPTGPAEAAGSTEDDAEYRWLMEQARKKREREARAAGPQEAEVDEAREDRAADDGPEEREAGPAPA